MVNKGITVRIMATLQVRLDMTKFNDLIPSISNIYIIVFANNIWNRSFGICRY